MKKMAVAVAVVMAVFSVVSPAAGGPSVSKLAQKALRYGKAANKRSKIAIKTARSAKASADSGVQAFEVASGDVAAAPNDFARFNVSCPRGYVATGPSMGLGALEPIAVLNFGTGYVGSYFNPSETSVYSGSLDVTCAVGYTVSSASKRVSKPEAMRALRRAERARKAR